ncbi:MAG: hypothetical protein EOP76_08235 [Variovorax sp.]|nr:MAG: hypothetical protein EOP76_08235 [Variovorax sp.]
MSVRSRLARWVAALLVFGAALAGQAAVPTSIPQFRVDAVMHTAAIGQIRADAPRNRVVTLSSDRTVRIWQLPSLRLIRVLRLPQEGSIEGLPVGLAISPDGRTVAVGGWTGRTWEQTTSIYLYDSVTGQMTRRIGGFQELISALDWSPDGRFLAVGQAGSQGVQILDTVAWKAVARDPEYQDSVSFLHYSAQGMLAASAGDGSVRLYDTAHGLVARQSVGVSKLLGGVRFSPDGKLLALGVIDKPLAMVLKVPSLDLAALRQVPDAQQKGLCCIAWSRDGSALFLNGEHGGSGATPLYRFDGGGLGAMQTLPIGNQRFTNMLPLPDGKLLFATSTPSLALLDAGGRMLRTVGTVIADTRDSASAVVLSADAQTIAMPTARGGAQVRTFSVPMLEQPPIDARLLPPRAPDGRFALEGFSPATAAPKVNGKPLEIHAGDRVAAYAMAHDGSALFVGTSWYLIKLDPSGQAVWRQNFSSELRGVNASADGTLVVITLADGTARWLRPSDGSEVLALFAHNNGRDWVLWRPDGYYASSEEGDQYVGWHVNRGLEREPDFYRAVQFERVFYRPDLLRSALDAPSPAAPPQRTAGARTRGAPASAVAPGSALALELEPIAPARLAVRETRTRLNANGRVEISLQVTGQARTLPMAQLAVYLNGIPVTPSAQRDLGGGERMRFERTLVVESDRAENDIRIEVDQAQSLGLVETYAELPAAVPKRPGARGRLIVLAVGINEFVNIPDRRKRALPDLAYAAQDAQAFSEALSAASGGLFREVKTVLLNDFTETKPDQAEIRKALLQLQQAGPDDTVVLFLASHGFSDKAGNYFFLNRDSSYEDVVGVVKGTNVSGEAPTLLSWTVFFDALRKTAGRRMLIVDTCHAQKIEGTLDTHALRKRSAASSFAFMVAAKGDEPSQEYDEGGHGLFTYALMDALKPASDRNGDGVVSLAEAFQHLAPMVEKLHDPRAGPQTPQLIAPGPLGELPLAMVGR